MKITRIAWRLLTALLATLCVNVVMLVHVTGTWWSILPVLLCFAGLNVMPCLYSFSLLKKRLKRLANGGEALLVFLISTVLSIGIFIGSFTGAYGTYGFHGNEKLWIFNILLVIVFESVLFWNGIARVYLRSEQLGINLRAVGILCGMIPIANLIVLGIILGKVFDEIFFEQKRLLLDQSREQAAICDTRYPILMVHGVFFRDFKYLNYWGRIPEALEKNGAKIFYGNHQSASSVADSGKELAERIQSVLKETGAEKVNIIAHSKGGLDVRYAIAALGIKEQVASLITVNTPHRGCEFADYLLSKIPENRQETIASGYNATLKRLGDSEPDFLAAVRDLTASACSARNEGLQDPEGIYTLSIGSKLNQASAGRFPLNFSYLLVNQFEGANDGLVGEKSFAWGGNYEYLTVKGKRGISHGDMIDLNRENIKEFDVREFYVQLVAKLKNMGL